MLPHFCDRSSFAADVPVGGDGKQCIAQLGQGYTQQIQLVLRQLTGKVVCNGCNCGSQFTWVHRITFLFILCVLR